jgi:hypothetical protein
LWVRAKRSQANDCAYLRAYLAARTALELHRWKEGASPGVSNNHQSMTQWARAIGATRRGDVAVEQSAVKELSDNSPA